MKSRKVPRGARRLRAYAEFESYLRDFAAGRYPFLWVVGRPGLGKSESVADACSGRDVYYRKGGQLSPLQLYLDCYRHRGQPLILDDAEHVLDDPAGARLVCALADTTRVRQVSWSSASRALGEVPQVYFTDSPLCVIANAATRHEAVRSRAVVLFFDPDNTEVHRAVSRWFWDQEVFDWFGAHIGRLPPLDARWYVHAWQDKRAGRDWRQILLQSHAADPEVQLIQDLEHDVARPEREDKARRFVELTRLSRATYFRLRRQLEGQGRLAVEEAPAIRLRRTAPPSAPTAVEMDLVTPAQQTPEANQPLRDAFSTPISGAAPPQRPQALDDLVAWEQPPEPDEDSDPPPGET